jgi:hypothetical protein
VTKRNPRKKHPPTRGSGKAKRQAPRIRERVPSDTENRIAAAIRAWRLRPRLIGGRPVDDAGLTCLIGPETLSSARFDPLAERVAVRVAPTAWHYLDDGSPVATKLAVGLGWITSADMEASTKALRDAKLGFNHACNKPLVLSPLTESPA